MRIAVPKAGMPERCLRRAYRDPDSGPLRAISLRIGGGGSSRPLPGSEGRPMAFTFTFLAAFLMVLLGVPWFRRPGTQARRSKVACLRGAFEDSFLAADVAHFLSDVGAWQVPTQDPISQCIIRNSAKTR